MGYGYWGRARVRAKVSGWVSVRVRGRVRVQGWCWGARAGR